MTTHDNTGQSIEEVARKTVDYLYTIEESTVIGALSPEIFQAISTLRQLVNEEFVVKDKSISSQLIYDILSPSISALINQARIETAQHIKEICPVTEGASVERLHNRIGNYLDQLALTNNTKEGKERV